MKIKSAREYSAFVRAEARRFGVAFVAIVVLLPLFVAIVTLELACTLCRTLSLSAVASRLAAGVRRLVNFQHAFSGWAVLMFAVTIVVVGGGACRTASGHHTPRPTSATLPPALQHVPVERTDTHFDVARGATNVVVGEFEFDGLPNEDILVHAITVKMGGEGGELMYLGAFVVDGHQFGFTQHMLSADTSYTFSGRHLLVPMRGRVRVQVRATVLTSAAVGTKTALVTLAGCSASTARTLVSLSCQPVTGQYVHVTP